VHAVLDRRRGYIYSQDEGHAGGTPKQSSNFKERRR
jgi:hypothetical protein